MFLLANLRGSLQCRKASSLNTRCWNSACTSIPSLLTWRKCTVSMVGPFMLFQDPPVNRTKRWPSCTWLRLRPWRYCLAASWIFSRTCSLPPPPKHKSWWRGCSKHYGEHRGGPCSLHTHWGKLNEGPWSLARLNLLKLFTGLTIDKR